jgi:hypothetical protein
MKKQWTSPKWQYVATWIFAILAMISGLSALQKGPVDLSAQTASFVEDTWDNGYSETFELIEARKK